MIRSTLLMLLLVIGVATSCSRTPGSQTAGSEAATTPDAHDDAHEPERVKLSAAARAASGIEVAPAGPHRLHVTLDLPGEVIPNADQLAHIVPRFPGIARQVRKSLGDAVSQGEVLAVIEGNQSLETYEVRSLISGTVIEKHVTLGEFLRDDQDIYVVADLSTVWVNISVYARDVHQVRRGQRVWIEAVGPGLTAEGAIDYVGSAVAEATRAATARVVVPNPGGRWRPGTFVTARIGIDERDAQVAVPAAAIQTIDGHDCVFVEDGGRFVVRPVTLGRSDGEWTEVRSGLAAGERYVSRGSFLLKSELQKSEAGHAH